MAFTEQVKVKIVNAHYRPDAETPTLNEWAGLNDGDIIIGTLYNSNNSVDIEAPCDYDSGQYGQTKKGDFTQLNECEFEVVSE